MRAAQARLRAAVLALAAAVDRELKLARDALEELRRQRPRGF